MWLEQTILLHKYHAILSYIFAEMRQIEIQLVLKIFCPEICPGLTMKILK